MNKVLIYAEGTATTNTTELRNSFLDLWQWLIGTMCGLPREHFEVRGFSKAELVVMHKNWRGDSATGLPLGPDEVMTLRKPHYPNAEALDLRIAREFPGLRSVDRLVIALDSSPKHNALPDGTEYWCRQAEHLLALRALESSPHLPVAFTTAAQQLRVHYESKPKPKVSRPDPQSKVEIVVMDRMFEDLPLLDVGGLRRALGVEDNHREWRAIDFKSPTHRPDWKIFMPACKCAPKSLHGLLGDTRDKASWAKFVLEKLAADSSPCWTHENSFFPHLKRVCKIRTPLSSYAPSAFSVRTSEQAFTVLRSHLPRVTEWPSVSADIIRCYAIPSPGAASPLPPCLLLIPEAGAQTGAMFGDLNALINHVPLRAMLGDGKATGSARYSLLHDSWLIAEIELIRAPAMAGAESIDAIPPASQRWIITLFRTTDALAVALLPSGALAAVTEIVGLSSPPELRYFARLFLGE